MNTFSRFQAIALVLGIVILFYAVYQSRGTAEAAVIKAYPVAAQFSFLGDYVAPFGLGRFLLYRWQAPTMPFPVYGYIPVKRTFWGRWRVGVGGQCSGTAPEQQADLVTFHAHYLWDTYSSNERTAYAVVCGRVTSAQVRTAVVTWEDGVVTEGLVKLGWFIILQPERQAACQLQLLDKARTVIRTLDLAQFDFTSTDATTPLPRCIGKADKAPSEK